MKIKIPCVLIALMLVTCTAVFMIHNRINGEKAIKAQPTIEFVTSRGTHIGVTEFYQNGRIYAVYVGNIRINPPEMRARIHLDSLSSGDLRDIAEVVERYEPK